MLGGLLFLTLCIQSVQNIPLLIVELTTGLHASTDIPNLYSLKLFSFNSTLVIVSFSDKTTQFMTSPDWKMKNLKIWKISKYENETQILEMK